MAENANKHNRYTEYKRRIANATSADEVVTLLTDYQAAEDPEKRINTINHEINLLKQEKKELLASMKAEKVDTSMRNFAGSRLIELFSEEGNDRLT